MQKIILPIVFGSRLLKLIIIYPYGNNSYVYSQNILHYRIIEKLGEGGMGEIFLAEDIRLNRKAALKVLPQNGNDDEGKSLLKEARAASALNHPNICTVYEICETDGCRFIAMEYVEGETLAAKIRRGRIDPTETMEIASQILDALVELHSNGIIHRDVKPQNIMITAKGAVKLMDFGLAETLSETDEDVRKDRAGTPLYMSPEQISRGSIDARSDIFSLGVMLYEMSSGAHPFSAINLHEALSAILNREPLPISLSADIPREFEKIINKALEKSLERRYQSASEMLGDLLKLKERLAVNMPESAAAPIGEIAFQGLLPFEEADRSRFFGREKDAANLFDMIKQREFRFGALFGDSGSGKTSLLKAGLTPMLRKTGPSPIYCRSYKDPLKAVIEECRRQCFIDPKENEPPIEYIRRAIEEQGALLIVCDQFEEFFTNFRTEEEREPFVSFVADCYNENDLAVKFLFSMRSDFMPLIGKTFDGRIPEPLMSDKRYLLHNFDYRVAQEIVERSAQRASLPFEKGFAECVTADLAAGRADKTVLPSELQIVGDMLERKRIFTTREYRRAGGKEKLVHDFLEDAIKASGDEEGSHLLLRCLISEESTKLTLTLEEIVRRTQRGEAHAERLLKHYARNRLIREMREDDERRYELMHEYLIRKINQITGRVIDASQRANMMFRQYLSNYSLDKRALIPFTKLRFVWRYSTLSRGESERELLKKSLKWGLAKASAISATLLLISAIAAAFLSVTEEWKETPLKDGHTAGVRRAVLSPNGKLLVSVGEDNKVIVWDFERREVLKIFTDHTDWVKDIAFSPDGKWFATCSRDKTVIVWDANRLVKVKTLHEHKTEVDSVAFSPDGKMLATASEPLEDKTFLWDTSSWEKIRTLPTGSVDHFTMLFSPDSRKILIRAYITDIDAAQPIYDADLLLQFRAFSQDYKMAIGCGDGVVSFLQTSWSKDGLKYKSIYSQRVHRELVRAAAFSPDGRYAATGSDNIIILWDATTQTIITRFNYSSQACWSLAFSHDGKRLISSHEDGAILIWDVEERQLIANLNEHAGTTHSVAFSSKGDLIVSGSEDRSVIVWDAASGRKKAVLIGQDTKVTAVDISHDGKSVASCDIDGNIIIWDLERQQAQTKFKQAGNQAFAVSISPDGRLTASTRGVFESAGGRRVADFSQAGQMYGTSFSADGRRLVSVTFNRDSPHLWNTENWELLNNPKFVRDRSMTSVSISPDGKHLVTGDDDNSVRLWQTEPMREIALIGRHDARVKSVAFSPDGKYVASSGEDKTIRLWTVNGRFVSYIGQHTSSVLSIAFSPDGKRLASGEGDGSVRVYTRSRSVWGYSLD